MSPEPKCGPTPGRTGNRLLDRLPEEEYDRLAPSLVSESLALKQILVEGDDPIRDVYFPTTALVSTLVVLEDGSEVETTLTGVEGMVGLPVALGIDFGLSKAICQVPGETWRLPAHAFREALEWSRPTDALFRRYAAVVLRQTAQIVACNARHPVSERLCRWLLMSHDRVGRDDFPMTHDFMAEMLGVRRQTVTVVAGTLQGAGLITVRRGMIRVVDRCRLEDASCECYGFIRALYDRILP
jgi:CRP-like cAMP-binding protein